MVAALRCSSTSTLLRATISPCYILTQVARAAIPVIVKALLFHHHHHAKPSHFPPNLRWDLTTPPCSFVGISVAVQSHSTGVNSRGLEYEPIKCGACTRTTVESSNGPYCRACVVRVRKHNSDANHLNHITSTAVNSMFWTVIGRPLTIGMQAAALSAPEAWLQIEHMSGWFVGLGKLHMSKRGSSMCGRHVFWMAGKRGAGVWS